MADTYAIDQPIVNSNTVSSGGTVVLVQDIDQSIVNANTFEADPIPQVDFILHFDSIDNAGTVNDVNGFTVEIILTGQSIDNTGNNVVPGFTAQVEGIHLPSIENTNIVQGFNYLSGQRLDESIVNTNTVSEPVIVAGNPFQSIVNVNTIGDLTVLFGPRPLESIVNKSVIPHPEFLINVDQYALESVVNTSTVNGFDDVFAAIGPESIVNESSVSSPFVALPNQIAPGSIQNKQKFGSMLISVQEVLDSVTPPSDPVTRNTNTFIPNGSRTIDGTIGERVAVFKDLATHFKAHPLTGDPSRVLNYESVKQSIRNIVLTDQFERPFQPNLSGRIREKLFEPFTPTLARELRDDITRAILNFEPRVIVVNIDVEDDPDNNRLAATIQFKLRTFQEVEEFELFLERI